MQRGFGRFNIAKKLSHYSGSFGCLEHPGISRTLATGYPEPEREFTCPVCGKACQVYYQQFGVICGCDRCIREMDPWEWEDDDG